MSTFCILPWTHIATNASGNFRPCCNVKNGFNFPANISKNDIESVWHSDYYQELRRQMLEGERPEICERCFREEDSGVKSSRQGYNERFMFDFEPSVTPPLKDVQYVDIRLGNLCNLKCRMCNPYASNQWVDEWKLISTDNVERYKHLNWPENDKVWENLELLENVVEIYLTGGEPTIIKEQYKLYDKLIERGVAKNIRLKYNTNLTNIPQKLVDYWEHFREIKLNASIDAYGELDRYIRYPSNWKSIDKNIRRFKQMPNVKLEVHTTIQMYNILRINELFDYCEEMNLNVFCNILNHPEHLNIRVLPEHLKENAAILFEKHYNIDIRKRESVVDYMFAEDWSHLLPEFWDFTNKIDASRNESFKDYVDIL